MWSASTSRASEAGHPPKKHMAAFEAIRRANFHITIHAGEAFGLESIWQAIQWCGAHRLGHGTRLRNDIEVLPDGSLKLGPLAQFVLDRRIPIEMCLLSNVHTGATPEPGGASLPTLPPRRIPRLSEYGRPTDERHLDDQGIRRPPPPPSGSIWSIWRRSP
ncbi:MAG: hypothetical protein QM755_24265 [Luteolibacter sp.]